MYLRKLFREPGPPRPRPLPEDEQRPGLKTRAAGLPGQPPLPPRRLSVSALPHNQSWQNHVDDNDVPFHDDNHESFTTTNEQAHRMYPGGHQNDDHIYPGLHLRLLATNENREAVNATPLQPLPPPFSTPLPLPPTARELRPNWKSKLFTTSKKIDSNIAVEAGKGEGDGTRLQQQHSTALASFEASQAYADTRNVVQRAIEVLKRKRKTHHRSHSIDVPASTTPSHASYLPDQDSLRKRAMAALRHSIDDPAPLPSLVSHKRLPSSNRFDESVLDPFQIDGSRGENATLAKLPRCPSNDIEQRPHSVGQDPLPRNKASSPIKSSVAIDSTSKTASAQTPPRPWNTEDSRQNSPLIPVKLQPPLVWIQNATNSQIHQHQPSTSLPTLARYGPRPPSTFVSGRPNSSDHRPVAATRLVEWQQYERTKGAPDFESWPMHTSHSPPEGKEDCSEVRSARPAPSATTIDSEVLQVRLANLLKGEQLRMAKGENRMGTNSQEKRAVVKGKAEARKGNKLATIFAPHNDVGVGGEEENGSKNAIKEAKQKLQSQLDELAEIHKKAKKEDRMIADLSRKLNEGPVALHRRGFAEKMFAEVGIGQSAVGMNESERERESRLLGPSPPSGSSFECPVAAGLPQVERLLSVPTQASPLTGKRTDPLDNGGPSGGYFDSTDELMVVNPGHPKFNWGSLGPPTELVKLEEQQGQEGEAGETQMQRERERKEQLVPQFGRSVDLVVPRSVEDSLDSWLGKEAVGQGGYSLTGSQIDTINRIQGWRLQTGATPAKELYAPSASATEPSAYHDRKHKDKVNDRETASQLTSISRRANVGGKVEREKWEEKGEESESDRSTMLVVNYNGHPRPSERTVKPVEVVESQGKEGKGDGTAKTTGRKPKPAPTKVEKLIDVASPPLTANCSGGTSHIRQMSEKDSKKLFKMLEEHLCDGPQMCTPPIPLPIQGVPWKEGGEDKGQEKRKGEDRWEELIQDLANDLESDVEAAVETLLSRYSEQMKSFYKSNPKMLLMVSLRAKVAKAARQEKATTQVDKGGHCTIVPALASIPTNVDLDPDTLNSLFGDEKQVERALQKIIDYVENAGEISQLQKSLLGLHQNLLKHNYDSATIDRRLALLEQAVYAKRKWGNEQTWLSS